MTDLAALIARLEAATEGSRELDFAIDSLINHREQAPRKPPGDNEPPPGFGDDELSRLMDPRPNYTTSLDAALTLVPEGWKYEVSEDEAWVSKLDGRFLVSSDTEFIGRGNSGPLSLCIAALRARHMTTSRASAPPAAP